MKRKGEYITAKPKRAYYGKYVLYENGKFMGQSDKLKELRVYYDGFVANKPNSVFTIKNMDTGEIIKTSEKVRRKPVKRATKQRVKKYIGKYPNRIAEVSGVVGKKGVMRVKTNSGEIFYIYAGGQVGSIPKLNEDVTSYPSYNVSKTLKNPVKKSVRKNPIAKQWNVYARMNTHTGQGWRKVASFPHNEIGKNDAKDYAYAYYEKHDGEIMVKVDDK